REKERVLDFEDIPNRDGGKVERNSEGGRPRNEYSSNFSSLLREERKWPAVTIVSDLRAWRPSVFD
ncbi:hypothetical protein Tco_1072702, partial [Tanacetum coccineum]